GREIPVLGFLGINLFFFACNLLGNLRHWHVWISFGRRLGHLFISPAHHQIHHSADPHHWGMNRRFELALWDWLYGTLHVPTQRAELRFGLGDGTERQWHAVSALYLRPFQVFVPKSWPSMLKVLRRYESNQK